MIQLHDVFTRDLLPQVQCDDWLELLRGAVAKAGSITKVAESLPYEKSSGSGKSVHRKHYSRGMVSQYVNGLNKTPPSKEFLTVLYRQYGAGRIACPAQKKNVTQTECLEYQAIKFERVVGMGYDRTTAWHVCRKCPVRSAV